MDSTHVIILNKDSDDIEVEGALVEEPVKIPQSLMEQIDGNIQNPKVANRMIAGQGFLIGVNSTTEENNYTKTKEYSFPFQVGDMMSNNENFDTLFKELKDDMRERESRTRGEISEREKRFERSLDKYHEENKEREERIFQVVTDIKNDNKEIKSEMKDEFNKLIGEFKKTQEIVSNLTKHNESIATTNKWSNVATIIGISAVVVAAIIALVT